MAVAVKTTASKARAMDGSEALFCDVIERTPLGVSKSTVQMESAEVQGENLTDQALLASRNTAQKLIVGDVPVPLHLVGLWLSHEDRQRQRSAHRKPDH